MSPVPIPLGGAQTVMGLGVSVAAPPPSSLAPPGFRKEEVTHLALFIMVLLPVKNWTSNRHEEIESHQENV